MLGGSLQSHSHPCRARVRVALTAALLLTALLVAGRAQADNLADYQFGPGWATFGLALPRGAAVGAVQVGALQTQTDVKTLWPDGSIRFAVVTANIPSAGTYPITANAPSGLEPFAPEWPQASVSFAIDGTTFRADLPAFSGADSWLNSGPLVREARVVVVPSADVLQHPLLQVVFDVRSYQGGGHRVDVTVQNVRDIFSANLVHYDVAIAVEGAMVYARGGVTQNFGTRWRKTFTTAGLTEAEVTPDFEPFYSSNALPRYLSSVTNFTYTVDTPAFDILRFGAMVDYMGGPGGRPEISPYPTWTAQYLVHKTQNLRAHMLANANLAGSWSSHVLEPDGATLIRLDRRPGYWLDSRSPAPNGPANGMRGAGYQIEAPHVPSVSYVPYVVTGDRYYLDELKIWGNALLLQTYPGDSHGFGTDTNIDSNRKGAMARLTPYAIQPRGFGWALREVVDSAVATPDNDPDKSFFATSVQNNLNWLDDYARSSDDGGILKPLFWEFDAGTDNHLGYYSASMWQISYLTWSVDHAALLGFGPSTSFRARAVATMVKLLTSAPDLPPEYGASVYYPRFGWFANGIHTPFLTMREFFDANYTTPPDRLDGLDTSIPRAPGPIVGYFGSDYRMLLLMGVRDQAPGADVALQWLMDYRTNGVGVLADINWRSGYALAPFVGGTPLEPPVIGAVPADPMIQNSPEGATFEYTVTALSSIDGPLVPVCTPASGFLFPVGMTIVTCKAIDSLGNASSKAFTVTVLAGVIDPGGGGDDGDDGTDGDLTIVQPQGEVVEAEGPWGIVLDYIPPVWHTSTASGWTTCNMPPGSTFPLGQTLLVCSASVGGLSASVSAIVLVVDTTKPAITVQSPMSGVYIRGQRVPVSFSCTDAVTGIKMCQSSVNEGATLDTAMPGPHLFVVLAMDNALNFAQELVSYTVKSPTPLTWSTPLEIVNGTPLSAAQLNAQVTLPGTFYYAPRAGTVLPEGANQELWVTFIPDDDNYAPAAGMVRINVRPRIAVTSPNTAMTWIAGGVRTITWSHNLGAGDPVNIDLSRDGGATWNRLATNVPTSAASGGTYNWVVTGPATSQARVRVTRSIEAAASDVSDVDFTIVTNFVTVTSPNGSGTLRMGDPRSITFSHNLGVGQVVSVDITRDGGATWNSISTMTTTSATSGSYAWIVSGPATTRARIRVSWQANAAIGDVSDVDFTITGPSITVTSPNGTGSLLIGDVQTITFTHNLGVGQLISFDLSIDGGATWSSIGGMMTTAGTSGTYQWVVSGPTTTQARVRVKWASQSAVCDSSDVNFAIVDTLTAQGKKK